MNAAQSSRPKTKKESKSRQPRVENGVSRKLDLLLKGFDGLQRYVKSLHRDVKSLRGAVVRLQKETATRKEMAAGFAAIRKETATRKEMGATRKEMAAGFAAIRREMEEGFAAAANEFIAVRADMSHGYSVLRKLINEQEARNEAERNANAKFRNEILTAMDYARGQYDNFRVEKTALAGAQMRLEEKVDVEIKKLKEADEKHDGAIQKLNVRVDRLEGGATIERVESSAGSE